MRYLFLFATIFLVSACAETELASHVVKKIPSQHGAQGQFKVGNPYQIEDQWYHPEEDYEFSQTGIASWYGAEFAGRRTANGEIFDPNELTAAHKTLQMPSLVRVTNLENGRSLVVRVNDRGPFTKSRVIDVSRRSAELLGFKSKGTAKVRLDVMTRESLELAQAAKRGADTRGTEVAMNENRIRRRSELLHEAAATTERPPLYLSRPPLPYVPGHVEEGRFMPDPIVSQVPTRPTQIYVQAGSFGNAQNAGHLAEKLSRFGASNVKTVTVNGNQFHRVRIGPIRDVASADALLKQLDQNGYHDTQIVVD